MELDGCRLPGLGGFQPEKFPWVSNPGNSLRGSVCWLCPQPAADHQQHGHLLPEVVLSLELALVTLFSFKFVSRIWGPSGQDRDLRIMDTRRNYVPSQNERTAQEGRGSVIKHLRDQFIWSKLPISQVEIHKPPPKSCVLWTSQMVLARVRPTHGTG